VLRDNLGQGAALSGNVLIVSRVTATHHYANSGAGFSVSSGTSMLLEDIVATDNTSAAFGGGLYVGGSGSITMRRVTSSRNLRPGGGGFGSGIFLNTTAASVTFEDITLEDNEQGGSGFGGGIFIQGSTSTRGTWTGGYVSGNDAAIGSAIMLNQGTWTLNQVDVRGNRSGFALGSVWVNEVASMTMVNSIVAGNNGGINVGGGSTMGASLVLVNVDSVGNASAGVRCFYGARLTMTNVTSAYNTGAGVDASGCASTSVTYGNLYGNAGGAAAGMTDPTGTSGNVAVVPGYTSYAASVSPLVWDLTLGPASALVNAGSPAILNVDGSRSDIGAYGGPGGSW
jgi:hypothetical protein